MAQRKKKIPNKFTIKYVISDLLKDCYVNGAFGGVTPRNEISMHLFCERHPIPKTITHDIKPDGSLSAESTTLKGAEVVRIIQSSVMMDLGTAEAIRDWLDDKIKYIKEFEKEISGKIPEKTEGKK